MRRLAIVQGKSTDLLRKTVETQKCATEGDYTTWTGGCTTGRTRLDKMWRARQDSNPQPLGPKFCVLRPKQCYQIRLSASVLRSLALLLYL